MNSITMNNVRLQHIEDTVVLDVVKDGQWIEIVFDKTDRQYKSLVTATEVTKGNHEAYKNSLAKKNGKCECKGCEL